jgi:Zn-dependent peptidase ImmA (M78 family)
MNFQGIKVPFLTKGEISKAADIFREKYWNDTIPVDIEKIISVNLRMDIIFKPGLFKQFNIDAYITSSWHQLCVDYDLFEADKNNNRLRFSYAHEIGHLVLHKNLKEKVIKQFISANQIKISEIDPKILNQYSAGPISKYFGVNSTPIEIALLDLNK